MYALRSYVYACCVYLYAFYGYIYAYVCVLTVGVCVVCLFDYVCFICVITATCLFDSFGCVCFSLNMLQHNRVLTSIGYLDKMPVACDCCCARFREVLPLKKKHIFFEFRSVKRLVKLQCLKKHQAK